MNTPLTDLQRELLSAHVDGELNDAERATVDALLKREDATEYVASLRSTADLVSTHAKVRAPVGLSGRVMSTLKSEFTPKAVGPGSEPFTSVPILSWRAPLYAAAAAIIVAVAIMFGPALVTPSSPDSVARGPLDDLPLPETRDTTVMEAVPAVSPAERPDEDPSMRRTGADEWGREASKHPEKLSAENAKVLKAGKSDRADAEKEPGTKAEDQHETGAAEASDAERKARMRDPSRAKGDTKTYDDDGGSAAGRVGAGGGRPAGGEKKNESDGTPRGALPPKDKVGDVKPPMQPPEPADEQDEINKESEGRMTIAISNAQTIAAQTDVLWISSLYGKAEVVDEEADVESVTVEVDADKLPELMAALRKLAREQGYGEVEGDDQAQGLARDEREQRHGIKGYLPADEPDKAESDAPKADAPKPESSDAEEKRTEKVRIVIKLK